MRDGSEQHRFVGRASVGLGSCGNPSAALAFERLSWEVDSNEPFEAVVPHASLAGRSILIIVENLPVPFDRRVWQEARTLKAAGAKVTVICPVGKGHEARHETIDGIEIYRHKLPNETCSKIGYICEYVSALWCETRLAWMYFSGMVSTQYMLATLQI